MDALLEKCKAHIPNKQLAMYKAVLNQEQCNSNLSDQQIRSLIANIMFNNPICSGCLKKDPQTLFKLRACSNCCLDFYCSQMCMYNHSSIHDKYCNNIDGDWPSTSPYRPVLLKIKDSNNIC